MVDKSLNILFPVLNEEGRLERGIVETVRTLDAFMPGRYLLTIVDNGSSDATGDIALDLCARYPQVRLMRLEERGVGAAVRSGIKANECSVVGYMDIDLATSPSYVANACEILRAGADVVNGSRWAARGSQGGRPLHRRIASVGLVGFLKIALGMRATDAVCGFKFFRHDVATQLVNAAGGEECGWSYLIEIIVRAERSGLSVVELPVQWEDDGKSGVRVMPQTMRYLKDVARMRKKLKAEGVL